MPASSRAMVMIYALEAAVWGALTAAWLSLRLALTPSLADQSVLVAAIALAVLHLLLSSALDDSPQTEDAYFCALFPLWVLYACMAIEAATSPLKLNAALFGGLFLYQVAAAISLSILTVQVLLSAAAVARGGVIWKSSALWLDHTLLLLSTLHACLSRESSLEFASVLLGLQIIFIGTLGLRLWNFEAVFGTLPLSHIFEILHASVAGVLGILTVAAAYKARTTAWVLPVVIFPLVLYAVLRAAFWQPVPVTPTSSASVAPSAPAQYELPPLEPPQSGAASARLVFPSAGTAPDQPHPPYGRLVVPPFPSLPPRPVVKKQL